MGTAVEWATAGRRGVDEAKQRRAEGGTTIEAAELSPPERDRRAPPSRCLHPMELLGQLPDATFQRLVHPAARLLRQARAGALQAEAVPQAAGVDQAVDAVDELATGSRVREPQGVTLAL